MILVDDFERIGHDINGNPRYKIHYSKLLTDRLKNEKHSCGTVFIKRHNKSRVEFTYYSLKAYQIFMVKENLLPFCNARIKDKEYISFTTYNLHDICDIINNNVLN